jgi:hypothetical protein
MVSARTVQDWLLESTVGVPPTHLQRRYNCWGGAPHRRCVIGRLSSTFQEYIGRNSGPGQTLWPQVRSTVDFAVLLGNPTSSSLPEKLRMSTSQLDNPCRSTFLIHTTTLLSGSACTLSSLPSLQSAPPLFSQKQKHSCALKASVYRWIGFMFSSNDVVRCTVRDGEMCMHLDDGSLKIPSQLLKKSQILMDALSTADPSVTRKVTVAAPKEWLQAWVACYCNEEESLSCITIKDLVNCLLVCFLLWNAGFVVSTYATDAVAVFTAWRVLA